MKKIGIVGASGYTGYELLKLLSRHKDVEVVFATSEQERGKPVTNIFSSLQKYEGLCFISAKEGRKIPTELVFLCLPSGESMKWAKIFLDQSVKVIDLGSDFRYSTVKSYKKWVGLSHSYPELLPGAVYGLPEWNRQLIKKAKLVSNPGCYPTGILLALLPLLKEKLVDFSPIIIDSKSGLSGAGSSPTKKTQFGEVHENITVYNPGHQHRHVGEMEDQFVKFSGQKITVLFTPHLVPMFRGIFSTIYVKFRNKMTRMNILELWKSFYNQEPFIVIMEEKLPNSQMALNTNYCFLGMEIIGESNWGILFSAIDNLGKGASGQAIQNMNLMLDLPESKGLLP